jgi:hypothetical protein
MRLPFSLEDFLATFRAYNAAIGFAPLLLLALAIGLVILAYSTARWRHRAIAAGLSALWIWSGVVYHWGFFSKINPAARIFGALFLVQAAIIIANGVFRDRLQFDPRGPRAWLGWVVIAYALAVYPLLGVAAGHGYPSGPSFGAPCPMTIFFFGLMLWTSGRVAVSNILLPLAWAIVGVVAAVQLGIREDFGLGVSAILMVAHVIRHRLGGAAPRLKPSETATELSPQP